MMFLVRGEVLRELVADPQWRQRLEKVVKMRDLERVVTEYCLAKGYKVNQLAK